MTLLFRPKLRWMISIFYFFVKQSKINKKQMNFTQVFITKTHNVNSLSNRLKTFFLRFVYHVKPVSYVSKQPQPTNLSLKTPPPTKQTRFHVHRDTIVHPSPLPPFLVPLERTTRLNLALNCFRAYRAPSTTSTTKL